MSRAWLFGDSVNTDQVIPGRYNVTTDPAALGAACFIEARPEFAATVRPGDVVIAGEDFGCGSSREHAVTAIQASGAGAVVAASFARIFFRNAVNRGLLILECPEALQNFSDGDEVAIDAATGRITNVTRGVTLQARPLPEFVNRIARHGGVLELVGAHGSLRGECPVCS
ncbi:MAG: LeuD/DmdB family oxidoreductase small subunit [Candidatus Dormibacteria bacterium]